MLKSIKLPTPGNKSKFNSYPQLKKIKSYFYNAYLQTKFR